MGDLSYLGQTHITSLGLVLLLLGFVLTLLPMSPFHAVITSLRADTGILQYINWICPISECAAILQAYITAFGTFYSVIILGRIVHVIH